MIFNIIRDVILKIGIVAQECTKNILGKSADKFLFESLIDSREGLKKFRIQLAIET